MKRTLVATVLLAGQIAAASGAPLVASSGAFNAATGQSAQDTVPSNGPTVSSFSGFSGGGVSGSASASGNPTTGQLRATATSGVAFDIIPFTGTVILDNTSTSASVSLSDTFSIVGSFSGVQSATLVVAVDGTLQSGPDALSFNGSSAFASFQLTVEGGLTQRVDEIAQFQDRGVCLTCNPPPYLQVGAGFKTASFSIPLLFSAQANSFTLSSSLLAQATLGGAALLGNTADISLILPSGFSVTSGSGFLFTADIGPVTGVPEPTALGVLALGLLGLAAARRRRPAFD